MLLSKEITVTINSFTKKYYESKGYFGKVGEKIKIKVEDLTRNSAEKVWVKCDYCNTPYLTEYRNYKNGEESIVHKNCCEKCANKKMEEIMDIKYGTHYSQQIPEVKEKTKETNLERYGVEFHLSNIEIREKIKETNLKKYGREWFADNNEFKDNFAKFIPVSKSQQYLGELFGGKINERIDKFFVDILLEQNIYLEYDGSGHDLAVKTGRLSEKEFKRKEQIRYYILKNKGLKQFKIIQRDLNDALPNDDILFKMKEIAIDYLINKNYNWIVFDLNKKIFRVKDKEIEFDYEELRIIKTN